MTRQTLCSGALSQPSGVFVHGVSVSPARMIYVSGMLAHDMSGKIVDLGDTRAQTRQCLRNIQTVLAMEEGRLEDIVEVPVFIRNMADFKRIHEGCWQYFTGDNVPASTVVEIVRSTENDALIEVEAVAAVPEPTWPR